MSIVIPTNIVHLIIALYFIILIGLTALLFKNRRRYKPFSLVLPLVVLWLIPLIGIAVVALGGLLRYSSKNIEI